MQMKSKSLAQQRVDQIRYFQAELALMEKEQVLYLDDQQRFAMTSYHVPYLP